MKSTTLLAIVAASLLASAALAQEVSETGRFQMEKSEDGFVRLDTRTGAMTLCREKDGALVCLMAADERAAYEEDLALLEKRVQALEQLSQTGSGLAAPSATPSDEEVERSIGIMERFMRSFFGLVEEFKQNEENPAPGVPQKT
ncbi:hypothetical protein HFC70_01120 [Agrobacterium sp. a22-2]|uniref:hypothetical protein n=1 Tax=Agrobacterium sp. a22-2 TaxID=2283840 RepID=UPI001444CAFE|nr:hypothetical protein [Agrobacterium sp. a22-2]NKN34949.1 hypothetical protein [Agrobacterium sp. a22-2]